MKWTLQDLRDTAAIWLRKASEANGLDVADVVAQLAADLTTIDKIQEVIHGRVELARTMPNLSSAHTQATGQPKEPICDSHGNTVPAGTLDAMGQGIAFIESSAERTAAGKTVTGLDLYSVSVATPKPKETGE